MLFRIVRAIIAFAVAPVILGFIVEAFIGVRVGEEISRYGLKGVVERLWNGPQAEQYPNQ